MTTAIPRGANSMARNAFYLGIGQVATTALTIVLNAAVARTLGASDYGLLYLLTSIATFAYVFVDWGYGPYIIREISRHPETAGDLMGTVLVVRGAAALLVCSLAVATTSLLGYDARTTVLTAVIILAWFPFYSALSYSWVFRASERMDYDALINVVLKCTMLGLSLICLALGGRLLALILVFAVAGTVTLALAILLHRRLRLSPLRATLSTALKLIHDSTPVLAMTLAVAVQPYIDANLLYMLVPRGVVGWYGAAWNIAGTLVAPASVIAATVYPRLSRAAGDSAELTRVLHAAIRPLVLVGALGAVGTYLFADLGVAIVYSQAKFGPTGDVLRAFAPVLPLLYVDVLLGHALVAAGKAWGMAIAKLSAVVLTTGLEFVLVPLCQARLGNGGIGIMFSMGAGELIMIVAAFVLIPPASRDRRTVLDLVRGLLAAASTLLIVRALPATGPFIGIPVCVVMFLAIASGIGLLRRGDLDILRTVYRRRNTVAESTSAPLDSA